MHVHATQSQGLAAIWLPLWKEQFGQSTPPWNTRPLCYKNQQLTSGFCGVFVWLLLAGWQNAARGGSGRAGAGAALWHARQDSWTATARAGLEDTAWAHCPAWGHWAGPVAVGHLGWGRWPGPTAALEPTEPAFLTALPGHAGALVFSISECVMLCWSN